MDVAEALAFVEQHHRAVLITTRADGRPQASPVLCGVGGGQVMVSTREKAMKTRNARRDPRISLCVVSDDFFSAWARVDGRAEIVPLPDAMEGLVDLYRSMSGEHPDWDDYRAAMVDQHRVLLRITVERAGPSRSG
ncbi:MAG: PPOX class F420-dependent oxidoreductase [Acidimicrobiales bacterium]